MGALTPLWAATSPEALNFNGKVRFRFNQIKILESTHKYLQFLIPFARVGVASNASQDPNVGEKLFEYFEEELKKLISEAPP